MPKTNAECIRECRARKKLLKQQKPPAQTIAQRCRKYRARKKSLKNAAATLPTLNLVNPGSIPPTRTTKSPAQRCREYRQRKKAMKEANAIAVERPDVSPIINVSFSVNDIQVDPVQVLHSETMETECDLPATPVVIRQSISGEVPFNINKQYTYSAYRQHYKAHQEFMNKFKNNSFGHVCTICDRLWFKEDLKLPLEAHHDILHIILPDISMENILACNTCFSSLNKKKIPTTSVYNGFKFPDIPDHLPPLDIISERFISPRIPFMQIRRLRHVNGQYGIYGQIINVPVCVDTMIKNLPRHVDDDYCINVHIKRRKIHRTSYLPGIVNKRTIKAWLLHLLPSPLYRMYGITVDETFFNNDQVMPQIPLEDVSEHIPIDEPLTAQQQTLLWNEDQYLRIAPGERNVLSSLQFDEHAEELSFPGIYLGQFRTFREDIRVTPFTIASSELRRSDRRATTPYHLLYMAMKIMRLRVRDSLTVAFKHIGKDTKVTRQQIQDEEYINNSMEQNLAFLRSIPNSAWYWSYRKKDLFAMIRQLGKPTIFLTMSANEIGWNDLLRCLYKFKHGKEISEQTVAELNYIEKTTLVNEDAVTCAVYFNKLINVLIRILESKKFSPFGKYYVVNYFKRIEFQHCGSPHAHILLWLANAPLDVLRNHKTEAIVLIDQLISVSSSEASTNIKIQKHKHTFTCYKKIVANRLQQCRFEAPFMPCRNTNILTPMLKEELGFQEYHKHYKSIRENLEKYDYTDMDNFYASNNIPSDDYYHNILRAGITRPRVFIKRQPHQKWHNPFNPFLFHILKSNMDIQFITDEYSCATYVAEYVNKTNRCVSNLQRLIIQTMNEHPEFDIVDITRNIGINMLNSVEMTSQEAAWYLLREPISKCSTAVVYIPTTWPIERQRVRKTNQQLDEMGIEDNSTNIWKENWFDKYEKRHLDLEAVTLAQFVANYTIHPNNTYAKRKIRRIIRYRNFDMALNLQEYKREMVSLHIPFRNEETEVLSELKFIQIYNDNENLILNRRKEFESNLDIQKTMEICQSLCREDNLEDKDETQIAANQHPDANPFQQLYSDSHGNMNADINLATLNRPSTTMTSLQQEFQRLPTNCLETRDQQMIEFIKQRKRLSIYSFNCQSLRTHATDVLNPVVKNCNVVIFYETWLREDEQISLPNFNCSIQHKRNHDRAGGVTIYHNEENAVNVLTSQVGLTAIQSTSSAAVTEDVGDICISVCRAMNGQKIVIVGVYISPNSHIDDIIAFLHGSLLRYTCDGGKLLSKRDDLKPLILTGEFNVNFTLDTSMKLIDFLQQQLNLQMINDRNILITKSGTTIDAVFFRYLDTIESRMYISYFSYHKPIVSTVAIAPVTQNVQSIEAPSNLQITEIN